LITEILSIDYKLGIWVVLGGILAIAIASTLINHNKKKKSNQEICISCRGIGFMPTYTSKPIPPCKRCNGTGYVKKK